MTSDALPVARPPGVAAPLHDPVIIGDLNGIHVEFTEALLQNGRSSINAQKFNGTKPIPDFTVGNIAPKTGTASNRLDAIGRAKGTLTVDQIFPGSDPNKASNAAVQFIETGALPAPATVVPQTTADLLQDAADNQTIDPAQSVILYKKAFDSRDATKEQKAVAAFAQARLLEQGGSNLNKNLQASGTWYQKAAELGDPVGQLEYGRYLSQGLGGFTKNLTTAREWTVRANQALHADESRDQLARIEGELRTAHPLAAAPIPHTAGHTTPEKLTAADLNDLSFATREGDISARAKAMGVDPKTIAALKGYTPPAQVGEGKSYADTMPKLDIKTAVPQHFGNITVTKDDKGILHFTDRKTHREIGADLSVDQKTATMHQLKAKAYGSDTANIVLKELNTASQTTASAAPPLRPMP